MGLKAACKRLYQQSAQNITSFTPVREPFRQTPERESAFCGVCPSVAGALAALTIRKPGNAKERFGRTKK